MFWILGSCVAVYLMFVTRNDEETQSKNALEDLKVKMEKSVLSRLWFQLFANISTAKLDT